MINPLFPYHLRDVAVCKGPDSKYYLTGTTDDNWGIAKGIRVWESYNLKDWYLLGDSGFVWTFDRDGSNPEQTKIVKRMGENDARNMGTGNSLYKWKLLDYLFGKQ